MTTYTRHMRVFNTWHSTQSFDLTRSVPVKFKSKIAFTILYYCRYETVAVSLTWAIILLAVHPEVQDIICKDLSSSDNSPLLDAFMLESLRSI